jgi:hypothetical protein
MGCEVVKVYRDHGVSGAKGRDERPQFDRLCRDATKRQFDAIIAWTVDRLGRSLRDLVKFLSEIHSLKIDLYLHQQGLDTATPAGKAMFQMMGVFAEFALGFLRGDRLQDQSECREFIGRARSIQIPSRLRATVGASPGLRISWVLTNHRNHGFPCQNRNAGSFTTGLWCNAYS